jgi:hypothetical protein
MAAFVAARLDEEEAAARELLRTAQDVSLELQDPALLGRHMPGWYSWPKVEAMCTGRLAGIAAGRAILAGHQPEAPGKYGGPDIPRCATCLSDRGGWAEDRQADLWPRKTVREVAAIWSDHPAYKGET